MLSSSQKAQQLKDFFHAMRYWFQTCLTSKEAQDHLVSSPRYFKYSVSVSPQTFQFVQPLTAVASMNCTLCYLRYASDRDKIWVKSLLQIT